MSELDLRYLEEGVDDVSIPRLRDMAEVYDRPLITFFLSQPAPNEDSLPDFRFKSSHRSRPWSPEMHRAFRRVAGQREVILSLIDESQDDSFKESFPAIDLGLELITDTERAATQVRNWLLSARVSSETFPQFREWLALIEGKGILVTHVSGVETSEMRGFSIGLEPCPAIGLNGADAVTARTFSLLHELVHVVLHHGGLCAVGDIGAGKEYSQATVEWFCNSVAAAVLMPRSVLMQIDSIANARKDKRWTDVELKRLAARFYVSREAMLLRLMSLGRATPEYYRSRRLHFAMQPDNQRQAGGPSYYRKKIRDLGRRYISTVLEARDRDEITEPSLLRYLDIQVKYVPKLISELAS